MSKYRGRQPLHRVWLPRYWGDEGGGDFFAFEMTNPKSTQPRGLKEAAVLLLQVGDAPQLQQGRAVAKPGRGGALQATQYANMPTSTRKPADQPTTRSTPAHREPPLWAAPACGPGAEEATTAECECG